MKYAFVTTNLLDLWSQPQFNSERLSQLFFGETVEWSTLRKGYLKVKQADGYKGWVDRRFVKTVSRKEAHQYRSKIRQVVARPQAKLRRRSTGQAQEPHFLFYGTPIVVGRQSNEIVACELPDRSKFWLSRNCLRPINIRSNTEVSGARLVLEAKRFLGVPYLWGGITSAGFDCSGLVQTVCGSFGITLPRDTKDQIKVGKPVARDDIRSGDLLFFERHVGFAIGRNKIVHASVGGSGVRVNALLPDLEDYREDLDRTFATARRIL